MRYLIWAGLAAFMIDQVSKYLVIHVMQLSRVLKIDVFPPLLNFRYGENRGINFGLLGDAPDAARWVLIVLALLISVAVFVWARRHAKSRLAQISAGLLIGGAMANVLDRLYYGYVLDFLNNSCCGFTNPFVYNLADVFIVGGALGLIIFTDPQPKKPKAKKAG